MIKAKTTILFTMIWQPFLNIGLDAKPTKRFKIMPKGSKKYVSFKSFIACTNCLQPQNCLSYQSDIIITIEQKLVLW